MKIFSAPAPPHAPALPADLASELVQYDATEPVSTPSAATTDAGYAAPGTTDADAFLSFLEALSQRGRLTIRPYSAILMEELVWYHVIIPRVDRTNRNWQSASLLTHPLDLRSQTHPLDLRPRLFEATLRRTMVTTRGLIAVTRAYQLYGMARVGSPEVGEAPCHPIRIKIGIVANSPRCTVCKGERRPRVSVAAPSPFPLVRRLFELALSLHNHGPIPTNYASVRGADVRIGVTELTTST